MPNCTGRWQHESSLAYYRGGEKGSTVSLISRFLFLLVGRSQVFFSQKDIQLFPSDFCFFSREWGKWEERMQHCSECTVIFSAKLFYLIKHSVLESKTLCGNIPQSQRSPSIRRKEINFQRRWIITPRDKGQVPMENLYAAMLSATAVGGLVPVSGVGQLQEWHLHHWLRHTYFPCTECSEHRELGMLRRWE